MLRTFIFDSYSFDAASNRASFNYRFSSGESFSETVTFNEVNTDYDASMLDRALFLAFILVGTSYYKTFPTRKVSFNTGEIDAWQSDFLNKVYQEGMSQFAYENNLTRDDLAQFSAGAARTSTSTPGSIKSGGIMALQSGGKDSLLTASLLSSSSIDFMPWYITSSEHHPAVLSTFRRPLTTVRRVIDRENLSKALAAGGLNGHVPVTYIVQSFAVIQAVLSGMDTILVSIAHEGEEPHAWIDDLPINHQWSKTWQAEQMFAEYVKRYVATNLKVGSPLRRFSELRVCELFVSHAWEKYGRDFSSCNVANYEQGADNTTLSWCGNCPKCANSYLLFAPFMDADNLQELFNGEDLFTKSSLTRTFKGILGVDGEMKPFECVGEVDELRLAYYAASDRGDYAPLPFKVPKSGFDYKKEYDSQDLGVSVNF